MLARQVHVAQLTCQAEELGLGDEIVVVDGYLLLLFKNKSTVGGEAYPGTGCSGLS